MGVALRTDAGGFTVRWDRDLADRYRAEGSWLDTTLVDVARAALAEGPDRVLLIASRYPTFRLGLQQGLGGALGSDVQFTRLEAGLSHTQNLGVLGRGQLSATAGAFVGTSRLQFMDYRHFAGNRAVLQARPAPAKPR